MNLRGSLRTPSVSFSQSAAHSKRLHRGSTPCARKAQFDNALEDLEVLQRSSVNKHIIQWYPGHIATAERQLQEHLAKVDIVIDVRDARCLSSTAHPSMDEWAKRKRRFVLVNRTDMVSADDLQRWRRHFNSTGLRVFYTNGQTGKGTGEVIQAANALSAEVNAGRKRRGLKARPVRACVVGFPNIGKSALINRLLKRKIVDSQRRPGVTRVLRWIRMGESLDLLDSPGIIPGSMKDQQVAENLAICNNIGEASYNCSAVAARFIERVLKLPDGKWLLQSAEDRYGVALGEGSTEDFVCALAEKLFFGDAEQAGQRILKDYRELRLGAFALEVPPVL